MADHLLSAPENRAEVETLRALGFRVRTDAELVAAFASRLSVSASTARMVLAGTLDDVVTV